MLRFSLLVIGFVASALAALYFTMTRPPTLFEQGELAVACSINPDAGECPLYLRTGRVIDRIPVPVSCANGEHQSVLNGVSYCVKKGYHAVAVSTDQSSVYSCRDGTRWTGAVDTDGVVCAEPQAPPPSPALGECPKDGTPGKSGACILHGETGMYLCGFEGCSRCGSVVPASACGLTDAAVTPDAFSVPPVTTSEAWTTLPGKK